MEKESILNSYKIFLKKLKNVFTFLELFDITYIVYVNIRN